MYIFIIIIIRRRRKRICYVICRTFERERRVSVKANRPDSITKEKEFRKCIHIDIGLPSERNTSMKVIEKLSKYKNMEIEINRMCGMKSETVPRVMGAVHHVSREMDSFTNSDKGNSNINVARRSPY